MDIKQFNRIFTHNIEIYEKLDHRKLGDNNDHKLEEMVDMNKYTDD